MSSVYYAVFCIAILIVMRWCFATETGLRTGIAGILAMSDRRSARKAKQSSGKSRFRRKQG